MNDMTPESATQVAWPAEPQKRDRAGWITWGLPELDPEHYGDWVYETLPPMSDFCEAEIERALAQVLTASRAIQCQLDSDTLPTEQRRKLRNIQARTLWPQQALLEVAIERLRDKQSSFTTGDLCRTAESLLAIFDAGAPIAEAMEGLDYLSRLFTRHRSPSGQMRVDRLRTALEIARHVQVC